jgi:hypothetical protein
MRYSDAMAGLVYSAACEETIGTGTDRPTRPAGRSEPSGTSARRGIQSRQLSPCEAELWRFVACDAMYRLRR